MRCETHCPSGRARWLPAAVAVVAAVAVDALSAVLATIVTVVLVSVTLLAGAGVVTLLLVLRAGPTRLHGPGRFRTAGHPPCPLPARQRWRGSARRRCWATWSARRPAMTTQTYGHNIGKLIEDYPDFHIHGETPTRPGYMATTAGAPEDQGATLRDLTLDGLAAQMDVRRHRLDGAEGGTEMRREQKTAMANANVSRKREREAIRKGDPGSPDPGPDCPRLRRGRGFLGRRSTIRPREATMRGACAGNGPVIHRPPGQQHWADLV